MRIAVMSDIHANLEALNAVLTDVEKRNVRKIYCCGNMVGYNADPRECIRLVQKKGVQCAQGDYDLVVVTLSNMGKFKEDARAAIMRTYQVLWKKEKKFLADLPTEIVENSITVLHGSLRGRYPGMNAQSMPEEIARQVKTRMLFFGHTHFPFVADIGNVFMVNPGSVGQPRDGDARASYAVVNTDTLTASIHRVQYDVEAAAQKIIKAGLPSVLAERLRKAV